VTERDRRTYTTLTLTLNLIEHGALDGVPTLFTLQGVFRTLTLEPIYLEFLYSGRSDIPLWLSIIIKSSILNLKLTVNFLRLFRLFFPISDAYQTDLKTYLISY